MKQIILILLVCICTNRVFSQRITNNTYDNNGVAEFALHILNYNNDLVVLSQSSEEQFIGTSGILIRNINQKGDLVWSDLYKDENDLWSYFLSGNDNSILINDSLLFAFGSAQDDNLDVNPTFFKYDLINMKAVDYKMYNSTYGGLFYTAHLHTDGYFYAGGIIFKDNDFVEYDMLLMKIDMNGEVIWEKEYAYGKQEDIFDIESYDDFLICTGRIVDPNINTHVFMSKIDTSGEVNQIKTFFEFGDDGVSAIEIQDNAIYMTSISEIEVVDNETTYLSKLDGNFNVVWDTLIASSSKYDLHARSMSIINDEIIILGNISPSYHHTNWKRWSYATSWSLDGQFNWEQRFYYDVDFIHFLDDVAALPNGDLVFMGTLGGFLEEDVFSQNLWLFKTDNKGCGTVQDTCYYTLDEYLDAKVNIVEFSILVNNKIQILGNPFGSHLQLQTINSKPLQLKFYNTAGQLIATKNINHQLNLNTQNWPAGIYFLQVYDKDELLGVKKLIKQ